VDCGETRETRAPRHKGRSMGGYKGSGSSLSDYTTTRLRPRQATHAHGTRRDETSDQWAHRADGADGETNTAQVALRELLPDTRPSTLATIATRRGQIAALSATIWSAIWLKRHRLNQSLPEIALPTLPSLLTLCFTIQASGESCLRLYRVACGRV